MTFTTPLLLLIFPVVLAGTVWLWAGRLHGRPSPRQMATLALRVLIFLALTLAAAGATFNRPRGAQAVAFVADLSASASGGQPGIVRFINSALQARGKDDVAATVAVGKTGLVDQPPAPLTGIQQFESVVDPDYTNLESGLALGGALLPSTYQRRVVLLSDGRENIGDAVGEAQLLRSEGIRVDTAPVTVSAGPEVRVDSLSVPSNLNRGERFAVDAEVNSTVRTSTTYQILEDGRAVKSGSVSLQVGETTISTEFQAGSPGMHTFTVVLQPQADTLPQNNQASAFSTVAGPPRILVVEGTPGGGANVARSIRASHQRADVIEASALTSDLSVLQRYASIVLVDVPADVLGNDTMVALRSFVKDLGHGLVVVGGTNSFGLGNYGSTPLEQALPVSMDLPKRKDLPTAAVVLIIEDLESQSSVNISKRAGEGVVGLLNPQDMVAVSDAEPALVWPLSHVTNKAAIVNAIEAMQPADPPSYTPFFQQAYDTLRKAKAQTKDIILLGDGDAMDDSQPILEKIKAAGIHVSTIETNASAPSDFQTMQDIAKWGGGKYYPADDVNKIPQIFLRVARAVAHSGIMQGKFFPQEVAPSPIIGGLTAVPPLYGYVITTPKPLSTVVLASTKSDPVLAQWQYGLGRAVVWTSDTQGRWSADWLADRQTRNLWSAMVNWTLPPPQSADLSLTASVAGGMVSVGVDSLDNTAYSSLSAHITGPNLSQTIDLQPTTTDHYAGEIQAGAAGAYLIEVQARLAGKTKKGNLTQTVSGGVVVPYAPDYQDNGVSYSSLDAIAAAGGGALLSSPRQAFADNLKSISVPTPLQAPLLALALLLLPIDVATRRLVMQRDDWVALLRAIVPRSKPANVTETGASPALAGVRQSRAARSRRRPWPASATVDSARNGGAGTAPAASASARSALSPPSENSRRGTSTGSVSPSQPDPAPREDSAATGKKPEIAASSSRLIEAKRNRARR